MFATTAKAESLHQ